MDIKNKVIVFDLDDTLFKEVDFLKSGYKAIVKRIFEDYLLFLSYRKLIQQYNMGENVFEVIVKQDKTKRINIDYLLEIYRNHIPKIKVTDSSKKKLYSLKERGFILSILTDGRSKTQRNKLKALKITHMFDDIVISEEFGSEKPNRRNYLYFEYKYPNCEYFYIGDNVKKDFVTPNKLGWTTIGIRDFNFENIHSQQIKISSEYLPKYWFDKLDDIEL